MCGKKHRNFDIKVRNIPAVVTDGDNGAPAGIEIEIAAGGFGCASDTIQIDQMIVVGNLDATEVAEKSPLVFQQKLGVPVADIFSFKGFAGYFFQLFKSVFRLISATELSRIRDLKLENSL